MKSDIVNILSSIKGDFEFGGTKITPDGKYMVAVDAISSQESNIKLWHLKTEELLASAELEYRYKYWLSITPDNKYIVVSHNDKVGVWTIPSCNLFYELNCEDNGSTILSGTVTNNSKYLFTGHQHGFILKWDLQEGEYLFEFPYKPPNRGFHSHGMSNITSLSITHDDKYLISGDSSGVINISRAINGEYIRTCGYMNEKDINDLAVSPSGNFITACRWENINDPRWDENVLVWKFLKSVLPNEPIYWSSSKMNIKFLLSHNLKPNEFDIYYSDIEYSPDGEYILGVGGIPAGIALLSIWDAHNGTCIRTIFSDENVYYNIFFIEDGKRLAITGSEGVEIWDFHKILKLENNLKWSYKTKEFLPCD